MKNLYQQLNRQQKLARAALRAAAETADRWRGHASRDVEVIEVRGQFIRYPDVQPFSSREY